MTEPWPDGGQGDGPGDHIPPEPTVASDLEEQEEQEQQQEQEDTPQTGRPLDTDSALVLYTNATMQPEAKRARPDPDEVGTSAPAPADSDQDPAILARLLLSNPTTTPGSSTSQPRQSRDKGKERAEPTGEDEVSTDSAPDDDVYPDSPPYNSTSRDIWDQWETQADISQQEVRARATSRGHGEKPLLNPKWSAPQ
jgi:hypothetical protein